MSEGIWEAIIASVVGIGSWNGYLHNKISKKMNVEDCKRIHEETAKRENILCDKIEELHTDVREIRNLLIEQIQNK